MSNVLEISGLSVEFDAPHGAVQALRNVDIAVPQGKIVGIVGESGCGKTTLISTVLRLLANNGRITAGKVAFEGEDVLAMSETELRRLRGRRIAMVFQDPLTSLNPVLSIERQMVDIQYRDALPYAAKRDRAVEMLQRVGIPDPGQRIAEYPHRFSGGMRQRIAIAMALLMQPVLLIADEPTTALDVTLEAQIIHLLQRLRESFSGSILFVSHNLGLIAELCDEVVVMYAGEVVEEGQVRDIFHRPRHPYTRLLLECDPARIEQPTRQLPTIGGTVPDLVRLPRGCIFAPRCPDAFDRCRLEPPASYPVGTGHRARCFLAAGGG
ncbi:MAG: ABC transporter ATP-binding protein [Proteobacteria bacterium]|nr:ABC transporter ATP-binding protein [Pseudomonadota bacterium]MBI3505758.1 ABC transporter ATP-binding protein [Pseudomonadota bacterium]